MVPAPETAMVYATAPAVEMQRAVPAIMAVQATGKTNKKSDTKRFPIIKRRPRFWQEYPAENRGRLFSCAIAVI